MIFLKPFEEGFSLLSKWHFFVSTKPKLSLNWFIGKQYVTGLQKLPFVFVYDLTIMHIRSCSALFPTSDTTPPPPAPFNHRIVSAKPNQIINFYTINWQEVLGG